MRIPHCNISISFTVPGVITSSPQLYFYVELVYRALAGSRQLVIVPLVLTNQAGITLSLISHLQKASHRTV